MNDWEMTGREVRRLLDGMKRNDPEALKRLASSVAAGNQVVIGDLITALAEDQEYAFVPFIMVYCNRIRGIVHHYAERARFDTEGAVNEILFKVWKGIGTIKDLGHLDGFIMVTAVNHCKNIVERHRYEPLLRDIVAGSESVEESERKLDKMLDRATWASVGRDGPAWESLLDSIRSAIAGLPPELQDVLYMRYVQGRTLEETAAALRVTVDRVKYCQSRAIQKIRDALTAANEDVTSLNMPGR
ncbi:MAG: sigma-70 family RNA polymerase sigma factor [Armatimonadetes bacterium]|nr:sigma-70 family RNA polymerase sigma factor [Armatimonadota bacterium]